MICKYFKIQELVPPQVYADRGYKAWELLDTNLLWTLDKLRARYGPIIINTWHTGGYRTESGLRTPDCKYYSPYSQHTFGRAADCLFVNPEIDIQSIRHDIFHNSYPFDFVFIKGIEENVEWLHIDVRNSKKIKRFKK